VLDRTETRPALHGADHSAIDRQLIPARAYAQRGSWGKGSPQASAGLDAENVEQAETRVSSALPNNYTIAEIRRSDERTEWAPAIAIRAERIRQRPAPPTAPVSRGFTS
jgi:hypothetical protein